MYIPKNLFSPQELPNSTKRAEWDAIGLILPRVGLNFILFV